MINLWWIAALASLGCAAAWAQGAPLKLVTVLALVEIRTGAVAVREVTDSDESCLLMAAARRCGAASDPDFA